MPKIICTVTNDLSHDQRMIRICGSLAAAGYEVCLVGRQRKNSPPLQERNFEQVRLNCFFEKGKFFYLEYNLRLLYYLYRNKCKTINAVDLDTLLPAYLVSRFRKRIVVFDAHEYFSETPEVVRRPLIKKIWEKLADTIVPKLTYCYTVGPALANIFSKKYKVAFEVIRNVPQKTVTAPAIIESPKIILYQGMLNEGRGLETAIEAMTFLDDSFQLWLAGKGDIEEQLQASVLEKNLSDKVKFLGFVPPNELPALTAKAWIGLNLLANNGLSYYYSLANKAFDYIQAGKPSIQMNFPEYKALQSQFNTFILIEKLDAKTLADNILNLSPSSDKYQNISLNCQKAAETLCWEKEEEKLLRFYQDVIFNKN